MRIDFSKAPIKNRAFSQKPMTFIDQSSKDFFAGIIDLIAIETGNRIAREHWQQKQLQNLLGHAVQRSGFWRDRIGPKQINNIDIADLPVLSRADLAKQVEIEGSLLPPDGPIPITGHATSGSSGRPVRFFVSQMNSYYNSARSLAQYFIEDRDLALNRTRFKPLQDRVENGFSVRKTEDWLGPASGLFRSGINKEVQHLHPNRELLLRELAKDPIGYLVVQPRLIDTVFHDRDLSFLRDNGTEMVIPVAEEIGGDLREKFGAVGIPVRSVYSTEEMGFVGAECSSFPETYHIAESNVIVEVDYRNGLTVGDQLLGRVLVTHLHSYATPMIRYEIGDFATISPKCACGHDGPTLSNIYGQKKRLLKRSDGKIVPFAMKAANILAIVDCEEYRIRQTAPETIKVEIGGIGQLTDVQMSKLQNLFRKHAGDEFQIQIVAVLRIEWGQDGKRLGFRSELF
jgi:phenylacetate-coenzyme A ligase PaaK-like adenylate-forming protein